MSTTFGRSESVAFSATRRVCVAIFASALLALPSVSPGDIAPDPLSGGVNFYGSTDMVEMSEEVVTLNITPPSAALFNRRQQQVHTKHG